MKMKPGYGSEAETSTQRHLRDVVLALTTLLAILITGGAYMHGEWAHFLAEQRTAVKREAEDHLQRLEIRLKNSLNATSLLATLVRTYGEIADFDGTAQALIESYDLSGTLQLAPGGVVERVYPLSNNEKALGHNLFSDPERREAAQAAARSRGPHLAPPVRLRQGGLGLIARNPIHVVDRHGNTAFWGFAIAVIHSDKLAASVQLEDLARHGYAYRLAYEHRSGARQVLAANSPELPANPAAALVSLSNGDTIRLEVVPENGWRFPPALPVQFALLCLAALLVAALLYHLLRRRVVLADMVAERTRELADTNARLGQEIREHEKTQEMLSQAHRFSESVLDNLPDMIFVKDARNLRFVRLNRAAEELLGYRREDMIGKTDYDFFPQGEADFFTRKDREVLDSGMLSEIETEEVKTRNRGTRLLHTKKVMIRGTSGEPEYLLGIAEDVTEQRAMDARLKQMNKIYNVLSAASDALMREHDRRGLLHEICRILVGYGGFGMACVYFVGSNETDFDLAAISGDQSRFPLNLSRAIRDPAHGDVGILRSAAEHRAVTCRGCESAESIWCRDAIDCGYRSCAAFPLSDHDGRAGGLALFANDPIQFGPEEMRLLGRLADKIAFALKAIHNAECSRRSEEQLRLAGHVFENSAEGIMITDAANRIVSVNHAFTTVTLYAPEEVLGKDPRFLASGRHGPEFYDAMWRSLQETGEWHGEVENRRKNGEVYPEWLNISVIRGDNGEVTHYIAIFTDLTTRKQVEQRAAQLAHFDTLTGLPNRAFFEQRVRSALEDARSQSQLAAVMFLDVDRFSVINETFGHRAGDQFLKEIATRLRASARQEDCVARLGGDEFTILLPGIEDSRDAERVARKILETLGQPIAIGSQQAYTSASIGIAVFPNHGRDADTLIRNADTALYKAMRLGGGRHHVYEQEMNHANQGRVALESKLHKALDRGEFELHYQPLLDVRSGRIVGAEALLRWHGGEDACSPAVFVPILEETGLILPVGRWVLRTACSHNRAWREAGFPDLFVAVNFSANQFRDRDFFRSIERILRKAGSDPRFLEIELTERVLMQDTDESARNLERLKSLGIRLSIDDFGTGYSSLSYLRRFPVDVIKIDRSFVQDAPQQPEAAAIVKSIIDMSRGLGLRTVAEGVETPEQERFVVEQGCDLLQGFLLSHPVSHDAFFAMLQSSAGHPHQATPGDTRAVAEPVAASAARTAAA